MRRIFTLLAIISATGVLFFAFLWQQFYTSAVERDGVILLSNRALEECSHDKIIDSLVLPHIKYHTAFDFYAQRLNLENRIKSGRYELTKGMSVVDVVRNLVLGIQSPVIVTFNNVRLAENLAGKISKQIDVDSIAMLNALKSSELARDFGFKNSAEMLSIFIPNSYELWWNTQPEEFVKRMKKESDRFWNMDREKKRIALNLSRVEAITLASILYEETNKVDEMPRIAGVYINRLRRGMKLQSDPTVKYAMGDFSIKRILHKHLKYDSPYNTYLYKGLPPSPIAVPSIAAIDAVLDYERHKYLFFCAREQMDGRHNFATTYIEHLRNARRYSAALNSRGIK